jgi:hypothetical protein
MADIPSHPVEESPVTFPSVSMDPHEEYFRSLKREEVQLVALREILYEGCWDEMVQDLLARKEGKPFVFKLQTRIEEDLQRIEKLRRYEMEHGVNLGAYVEVANSVVRSRER